jgi:hypothetical protein
MKLRDDVELWDMVRHEVFSTAVHAIGDKGIRGSTAMEVAERILDAVDLALDRRTPTAPPEAPAALPGAVEHCPGCNCPASPDCTMSCDTMSDCGHRPPAATPGTAPTPPGEHRGWIDLLCERPECVDAFAKLPEGEDAPKCPPGTPRGDE